MKFFKIIFLLVYVISNQAQSQTESPSFLDRTEFKVGYYGNAIWDNGLNLGAEYTWKKKEKIKEKKKGQKTITHQLLFNGSLGYSTNFGNKTDNALSSHLGIIGRRTGSRRWQLNVALNPLGYHRSFLPETVEVKGDEVTNVRIPGRSYYAPSIALGIGRLRKGKRHSGWYFNYAYTIRTPFNAGVLPTHSVKYGHRFNFKKKR